MFFFLGFAIAFLCLFVNGHPYLKYRIMNSIHFVHFLALLSFVGTTLPGVTSGFNWVLYRVFIAKFNGVFNASMIAPFANDPDFARRLYKPAYA